MGRVIALTLFLTAVFEVTATAKGVSAAPCTNGELGTCEKHHQARTLLQHAAGILQDTESVLGPGGMLEIDHKVQAAGSGVESKQAPGGIKDYINGQLLPTAEATKTELQGEVTRAAEAFESCSSDLTTVEDSFRQQEATLITAEQRHEECEMKVEMGNRSEAQYCGDLDSYAANLQAPVDLSTVNTSNVDEFIAALGTMDEYFSSVFPELKSKKQKCEVAKSDEEVTKESCAADKKSIETSWCSLNSERNSACKTFGECFISKDTKFDDVVKYVKAIEENSKLNFKTLACHGDSDCTATESDTSHLSVQYPIKPQKIECDSAIKTNWNYADVVCDETTVVVETPTTVAPVVVPTADNDTAPAHL